MATQNAVWAISRAVESGSDNAHCLRARSFSAPLQARPQIGYKTIEYDQTRTPSVRRSLRLSSRIAQDGGSSNVALRQRKQALIFIMQTDSKQLKLPDRLEITLCEAVTAFVFGKANDVVEEMVNGETETEEHSAKVKILTRKLQSAAYAGRIKFRALKNGDNHADGHKDIDHLYFSEERGFRWDRDEIWVRDVSPERPEFKPQRAFRMDWHDVHLDRKDLEALLRGMGVSVIQGFDTDAPGKRKTLKTGMPGRPTSKHLVLEMARRRLEGGDYPPTLAAFSRELADALPLDEPDAAPMTAKTVSNAIRKVWHARQKSARPAGSS